MRSAKDNLLLFLKGVGMGGADVVPGVSGGTIAFITGIYEELIRSIKSIDIEALRMLFRLQLKDFWKKINGPFLLVLVLGIATSLLTLVRIISYLLTNFPTELWSFFMGLILASAILVLRQVGRWKVLQVLGVVIGIATGFAITSISPAETSTGLPFILLSGMLAICAMILPGISGSFILLLLGKYEYIITSLKEFRVSVIIVFGVGCVIGLTLFSRVVSWVLNRYHDVTVALLSGFMLGSLNKIWPWKEVVQYRMTSDGNQIPLVERNLLPNDYQEITGIDANILNAVLFAALGIFVVVAFDRIAYWSKSLKDR